MPRLALTPAATPTHAALADVFRALAPRCATEKTRPRSAVIGVGVTVAGANTRIEGTDGHALVRVVVPTVWLTDAGIDLPTGIYAPALSAARLALGEQPVRMEIATPWPHTDGVVPPPSDESRPAWFNPVLLAEVCTCVGRVARALGAKADMPARLTLSSDPCAPARLDRQVFGLTVADVVAVIMPMRE